MANDLNQVTIIGRLTRDPELRQVGSGGQSVCNFGIANNRTFVSNGNKRDEVSFFNCVAWGRLGEIINQYCQKGKQIAVSGRLRQDSYDDKEGRKVSKVEIVVENMQLLGSREGGSDFQSNSGSQESSYGATPAAPQNNSWQNNPNPSQGTGSYAPQSGGYGSSSNDQQSYGGSSGYQDNNSYQGGSSAPGNPAPPSNQNFSDDDIPF